jgi:hypothetical protein
MKKVVLTLVLGFSFLFTFANVSVNNDPIPTKNVKIVSVEYKQNSYEKEVQCVVTINVGGNVVVGHGSGMTAREACDNAYAAAREFL